MRTPNLDEESIFDVARRIESAELRADYLDQVCGTSNELKDRLAEMLQAFDTEQSYLERPAIGRTVDVREVTEKSGDVIGPYKLLQKIGEGGFGVVYMAEQSRPVRRKVALKVIKPGMDTKEVVARFEAERQALAMMNHPNIARVFDGGETETRRPYFVMELVKGIPVTEFCDEQRLETDARLRLFITICGAIQHAHQKGVIHRDVKPSNVLITLHDGEAVPKVIDFGVSKAINQQLTERTLFTSYGQMVGTPQYMSPEQAEMSGLDVDTRSDIYSLGVLLYELLTGTTPLEGKRLRTAGFAEMQKLIREEDPPKPSTRVSSVTQQVSAAARQRGITPEALRRSLQGDLDCVVMRALEKDRNRRYETANGLARDIERYLASEPVVAGPPTAAYRLSKFLRRNRGAVLSLCAVAAALVVGLCVAIAGYVRASQLRAVAERKEREAVQEAEKSRLLGDTVIDILASAKPNEKRGSNFTVRELLDDFVDSMDKRLLDHPDVKSDVYVALGNTYFDLLLEEKVEAAADCFRKAEILRREHFGDKSRAVAEALFWRGVVVRAPEPLRRSIEIQRSFGTEDSLYIASLSSLSWLLVMSYDGPAKLDEAEELAREAIRLWEASPTYEPYWRSADNGFGALCNVYRCRDDAERALKYAEKRMDFLRATREPGIELGWGHNLLAGLYLAVGKVSEAEQHSESAMNTFRDFGVAHALRLGLFKCLAIQAHKGDFSDVLATSEEYCRLLEEDVMGDDSAAKSYFGLARFFESLGDLSRARELYGQSATRLNDRRNLTHVQASMEAANLGVEGDTLRQVRPFLHDTVGGPMTRYKHVLARIVLAQMLLKDQTRESAELAARLAGEVIALYDDRDATFGHAYQARALLTRAQCQQGALDEALETIRTVPVRPGSAFISSSVVPYARAERALISKLREEGRLAQSIEILEQGLAKRREKLADNHPQIAFTLLELARDLLAMERFEEAAEYAESAHKILDRHAVAPRERAAEAAKLVTEIEAARDG